MPKFAIVEKHLGSVHDQQTHGRRKTAAGVPDYKNAFDTEGKYSPEARKLAKQIRAKRVQAEPKITADMVELVGGQGGELVGLAHRVKTEKSIARKIDADFAESEGRMTREQVAEAMGDIVRYTALIPDDRYPSGAMEILGQLASKGYTVERVKNFWQQGDAYNGINVKVRHSESGARIELQFHTPQSFSIKDKSHKLYEKYRTEENPIDRYVYWQGMTNLWLEARVPEGVLEVGELVLEQYSAILQKFISKSGWKFINHETDDGTIVARYRFKDTGSQFIEERLQAGKWVPCTRVAGYMAFGTWDVEPYEAGFYDTKVSKHLGTQHDQTTHGRRKKGSGLSAVREAARGTGLDRHTYSPDQIEGQLGIFTEEPYEKAPQAEYKVGNGTVKDRQPMPKGTHQQMGSKEAVEQLAEDIFNLEIEIDGEDQSIRVEVDYLSGASGIAPGVKGKIYLGDNEIGSFERTLGDGYVYNNWFSLAPGYQGQGLGTTILKHWEDQYYQAGYEEMRVDATSSGTGMNGAYTWLKYGYTPDNPVDVANEFLVVQMSKTLDDDGVASAKRLVKSLEDLGFKPEDYNYNGELDDFLERAGGSYSSNVDRLTEAITEAAYNYGVNELLYVASVNDDFKDFLLGGEGKVSWEGRKQTEPLFDGSYSKGFNPSALAVISRWMLKDPAGLENDDPKFWQDIRDAYEGVSKHLGSQHDQSTHGRRKTGLSGIRMTLRPVGGGRFKLTPEVPQVSFEMPSLVDRALSRIGNLSMVPVKPTVEEAKALSDELLANGETMDAYWEGFATGISDDLPKDSNAVWRRRTWDGDYQEFITRHIKGARTAARKLAKEGKVGEAWDIAGKTRNAVALNKEFTWSDAYLSAIRATPTSSRNKREASRVKREATEILQEQGYSKKQIRQTLAGVVAPSQRERVQAILGAGGMTSSEVMWINSGMDEEFFGTYGGVAKGSGGLSQWFKEKWVDLSRPKEGGGYEPCGRADADEGKYPKCVPASRAAKMTPEEIKSAIRRKRRAESTQRRDGKKPINVSTVKKANIPTDMELYNRVKSEAKRKFDVYPSAYANGWLVQEYKRRGGKYKTVQKDSPTVNTVHVDSIMSTKRKKRKKYGISGMVEKHVQHDQKTHGRRKTPAYVSRPEVEPVGGPVMPPGGKAFKLKNGFEIVDSNGDPDPATEDKFEKAMKIFNFEMKTNVGQVSVVLDLGAFISLDGDVSGIIELDGYYIGEFNRRLGENSVYNTSFTLESDYQGLGIGTAILNHWEDQYRRAGYTTMSTHAVSSTSNDMNGGYTWARYGYEADNKQYIERHLSDWLGGIVQGSEIEARKKELSDFVGIETQKFGETTYEWTRRVTEVTGTEWLPLLAADTSGTFKKFLAEYGDWRGTKVTETYITKSEAPTDIVRRWMMDDPAGLENDAPEFWQQVRDAYAEVYGSVSKHAEHDQKTHGRRKGQSQLPGVDWEKYKPDPKASWPKDVSELEEGTSIKATIEEVAEHYEMLNPGYESSDGDTVVRASDGTYYKMARSESGEVSISGFYRGVDEMLNDVDITEMEEAVQKQWQQDMASSQLFHGTNAANAESIRENGLEPSTGTRGISNRDIGRAIFAHPDEFFTYTYGQEGSVFRIDLPQMIADGLLTPEDLGREPGFSESEARQGVAYAFEEYDWYSDTGWDGTDGNTVILNESIPTKYLKEFSPR